MPFGVRKWPDSCDPRGPCFCLEPYAPGAVPPFAYRIQTTGALPPLDWLNAGDIVTFTVRVGLACQFPNGEPIPGVLNANLDTSPIFDWLNLPPPLHTLEWILRVAEGTGNLHQGQSSARFPDAVGMPPAISMSATVGPELIPNPVTITPVKWDTT